MKRLLAVLFLAVAGICYAAQDEADYPPVKISSIGTNVRVTQPTLINFNYPGPGQRNCITDISVSGDNFPPGGWTVYILDGQNGTTNYALNQTTMNVVESWYPKFPLCLSMNTTTYMYVSTGNFKLNASGFEKPR